MRSDSINDVQISFTRTKLVLGAVIAAFGVISPIAYAILHGPVADSYAIKANTAQIDEMRRRSAGFEQHLGEIDRRLEEIGQMRVMLDYLVNAQQRNERRAGYTPPPAPKP